MACTDRLEDAFEGLHAASQSIFLFATCEEGLSDRGQTLRGQMSQEMIEEV